MIDYDRLVYKSTWGTSRKITLADALDEMDVQEFEETPIIVFTDPDQSYYTEQSKYFKDFDVRKTVQATGRPYIRD